MKLTANVRAEPHVPFISLADLAWQIIIFFLLAATFRYNDSLNVDLPAGKASQTEQPQTITVVIAESTVTVNGQPCEVSQLSQRLSSMLAGRTREQDRAVEVQTQEDVPFQREADVMYAIQQAGGVLLFGQEGSQ